MPDLTTTYLGLKLKNPLVASASPLSKRVDIARRLEAHGAAAVVMYSLFEEQITPRERVARLPARAPAPSTSPRRSPTSRRCTAPTASGPSRTSTTSPTSRRAVRIPVIASLNGIDARRLGRLRASGSQEAGADALELNIYSLPTDPTVTSPELEDAYVELVREVRRQVTIPLAVKLSPFFTSIPNICARLAEAGRERARAVQPLLPARLRPRERSRSSRTSG